MRKKVNNEKEKKWGRIPCAHVLVQVLQRDGTSKGETDRNAEIFIIKNWLKHLWG